MHPAERSVIRRGLSGLAPSVGRSECDALRMAFLGYMNPRGTAIAENLGLAGLARPLHYHALASHRLLPQSVRGVVAALLVRAPVRRVRLLQEQRRALQAGHPRAVPAQDMRRH